MATGFRQRAAAALATLKSLLQRADSGADISFYRLRFGNKATEEYFVRSTRQKLTANARILCSLGIMLAALAVWLDETTDIGNKRLGVGFLQKYKFHGMIMVQAVIGILWTLPCVHERMSSSSFEMVLVVQLCLCFIPCVGGTPWYHCRLHGEDPRVLLDPGSQTDTTLLLMIDCITTSVHFVLPLRARALVPFQMCAIMSYAIPAIVLESPESTMVTFNSAILAVLVAMAAMGKRSMEYHERVGFAKFLRERELRARSEYQLSLQLQGKGNNDGLYSSARSVNNESLPETVDSGRAWSQADSTAFTNIVNAGLREHWLVPQEELKLLPDAVLGEGGFGVVCRGLYHGAEVAVKTPKDEDEEGLAGSDAAVGDLCNELRVLRRLRHPNICFLYGAMVTGTRETFKLSLVLELVHGESLINFVTRLRGEFLLRASMLVDVASALCYLHTRKPAAVVHGDLKADNVFAQPTHEGRWRAKLLDFGLSRLLTKRARPLGGTAGWKAPESMAANRPPTTASDVFSFGLLASFVSSGRLPLEPPVAGGQAATDPERLGLQWPGEVAEELHTLVDNCCRSDMKARPDMREVLQVVKDMEFIVGPLQPASAEGDMPPCEHSSSSVVAVAWPSSREFQGRSLTPGRGSGPR